MFEVKSGIYRIRNRVNGKHYIGSSVRLKNRKLEHFHKLKANTHENKYLQNSFNKYGESNFSFEVMEYIEDVNSLIQVEQLYLDIFYDNKNKCYNILPTAGSTLGYKHTSDSKQKIGQAQKGKVVSNETKQKISEAKKGKTFNEIHRKKLSEIKKASYNGVNNPNYKGVITAYKIDTSESIGEFPSLKDVSEKLLISQSSVSSVLTGRIKSIKGYYFERVA